jgi:hypothetical protein
MTEKNIVDRALEFSQRYGTSDPDEIRRRLLGTQKEARAADGSLARLLDFLTEDQRDNYRAVHGSELTADPDDVRVVGMALVDEVMELCKELGWKPWKPNHVANAELVAEEFADVVCFFGTLAAIVMEKTGFSAADLQEAYRRKQAKNRARFRGEVPGYEGSAASRVDPITGRLHGLQVKGDFRDCWFDVEYAGGTFRAQYQGWWQGEPLEDGTPVYKYNFLRDDNGSKVVLKPQLEVVKVRLARDPLVFGRYYDVVIAGLSGQVPFEFKQLEYLGRRTSAGSHGYHVFKGAPHYLDPESPWWGATESGWPHAGVYYQIGPEMRRRFVRDDGFRWWFEDAMGTPMAYQIGIPITRSFDYGEARAEY